jgi:AP-1 complex subunit gamma-1
VQRHRHTIVECVKDSDVTIRRSALQLVYNLVNENNITTLAKAGRCASVCVELTLNPKP